MNIVIAVLLLISGIAAMVNGDGWHHSATANRRRVQKLEADLLVEMQNMRKALAEINETNRTGKLNRVVGQLHAKGQG